MKLVEYISSKLNEFLRGFQTDQPIIPFLCAALETLLRLFMNMFISRDVMTNNANTLMNMFISRDVMTNNANTLMNMFISRDVMTNNANTLMNMFISRDVMTNNANTLMKLLKVNVTDKGTIDIGLGAKMHVAEYKKSPHFKETVLKEFWKGAQITLCRVWSIICWKYHL